MFFTFKIYTGVRFENKRSDASKIQSGSAVLFAKVDSVIICNRFNFKIEVVFNFYIEQSVTLH
jgi:hypothetical protein